MDVSNMKIGAYNFLVVGVTAVLFIVLAKMVFTKFPVPGVSEVVQSV